MNITHENMFTPHFTLPVLQRTKKKLFNIESVHLGITKPLDTFHDYTIVHPVTEGNRIHFAFLFLHKSNLNRYFVFKPVMNRKRETVSIIYEFGCEVDAELATLALLYLFKSSLFQPHTPVFVLPEFDEIIDLLEGIVRYVPCNNEWEWWRS
jgi:hypothetical protein